MSVYMSYSQSPVVTHQDVAFGEANVEHLSAFRRQFEQAEEPLASLYSTLDNRPGPLRTLRIPFHPRARASCVWQTSGGCGKSEERLRDR